MIKQMTYITCYRFIEIIYLSALIIALSGCGPSDADNKFIDQVEQTKQQSKIYEIKAATIPFALKHHPREIIPSKEVPGQISALPILSEAAGEVEAIFLTEDKTGTNAVMFEIGSGFGHWGIIVCPSDNEDCRKARSGLAGTVIPWQEGVYFWASWQVRGVPNEYWNK
jgi:hypothetical protein